MVCTWSIFLTAAKWDTMASCTKSEYKSDNPPDKCGYQDAQCQYVTADHAGVPVYCKVRRKGSTSWRDLHARPSFKIKKMNNTKYPFGTNWASKKVTLNNGVQKLSGLPEAEVKAYDIFRNLGVPASLAQLCSVKLYRDGELFSTEKDYTMIETISDDIFMIKHFHSNWTLWEVESGKTECKRSYPNELVCDTDTTDITTLTLDDVDQTEMINYFVGERLTSHTDSACLGFPTGNNYYVAKWYPLPDTPRYTYIPSGVDQTFKCWYQYAAVFPQCKPIQQCWDIDQCWDQFQTRYEYARDNIYNHVWSCVSMWHRVTMGAVGGTAAAAPLLLGLL